MRTRLPALAAGVFVLTLLITGCTGTAPKPEQSTAAQSSQGQQSLLSAYGLAGMDAREVIEKLDATPLDERPDSLQVSIRPDSLMLVGDGGATAELPMPEDATYLAFAPFVTQTHECTFHAPNSCVGEMRAASITVTITDKASGEVYVDEQAVTYDNGFIGYWLPRDIDATVSVTADGRTGSVDVTTRGDDAPTCITTLQIA